MPLIEVELTLSHHHLEFLATHLPQLKLAGETFKPVRTGSYMQGLDEIYKNEILQQVLKALGRA